MALRRAHRVVGDYSDFVLYWCNHAAGLARTGMIQQFGFIATNSIRQIFNRRVLEKHLSAEPALYIVYAIPDHPWVDSAEGAAVRISMTVATTRIQVGVLRTLLRETEQQDGAVNVEFSEKNGTILADLSIGAELGTCALLRSNSGLCCNGMVLCGGAFVVNSQEALQLGLGRLAGLDRHIVPYVSGRELNTRPLEQRVIDLFGLSAEEVMTKFPEVFQRIVECIKPDRDLKTDRTFREKWWLFGRTRQELRRAIRGVERYIATTETSKHRFFRFLDPSTIPDHMVVAIALDDAYALGILSSSIHVLWSLAAGGRLGVGNDPRYNKSRCFDPFPFPVSTESQQARIRELGEALDAH